MSLTPQKIFNTCRICNTYLKMFQPIKLGLVEKLATKLHLKVTYLINKGLIQVEFEKKKLSKLLHTCTLID